MQPGQGQPKLQRQLTSKPASKSKLLPRHTLHKTKARNTVLKKVSEKSTNAPVKQALKRCINTRLLVSGDGYSSETVHQLAAECSSDCHEIDDGSQHACCATNLHTNGLLHKQNRLNTRTHWHPSTSVLLQCQLLKRTAQRKLLQIREDHAVSKLKRRNTSAGSSKKPGQVKQRIKLYARAAERLPASCKLYKIWQIIGRRVEHRARHNHGILANRLRRHVFPRPNESNLPSAVRLFLSPLAPPSNHQRSREE